MDNLDDALLTAAERARQAEEGLRETSPEDPAIVPKADRVFQRAEEVEELAGCGPGGRNGGLASPMVNQGGRG